MNKETKKTKIAVSENVFSMLNYIKLELKNKGVTDGSEPSDILDYVFDHLDKRIIHQFIDEKTPDSYKLQELSSNDEFKEDLKKLIKSYEKKKKVNSPIFEPAPVA